VRELLKQMRVEAKLTQAELAEALNNPQSYIAKYENGERKLGLVEVAGICEAVGSSLLVFSELYKDRIK
jgi:transcriptional regulator with XRE-family HTH domain